MDREDKLRDMLAPIVGLLAIILFSLMMGVGAYLSVILVQVGPPDFANIAKEQLGPLSMAAIGLALSGLVMGAAIPKIVTKETVDKLDSKQSFESLASRLADLYKTNTIIAGALFEAPAFVGAMAYHLDGSAIGFAVAGVMVLAMLSLTPTPGRVASWVDRQMQQVEYRGSSNKESF